MRVVPALEKKERTNKRDTAKVDEKKKEQEYDEGEGKEDRKRRRD